MEKQDIEQLYHLLRLASNISEDHKMNTKTCLTPQEQVDVIYGLCRHLLAGGDYLALVKYSQFYGESYLVEPTFNAIKEYGWQPKRIVELGAGLGWLARGLSAKFGMMPYLLVDKRPWPLIGLVADLETEEGKGLILNALQEDDLIVACDLIHCLDEPNDIMDDFSSWRTVVLEYYPVDLAHRGSYSMQIHRYGAWPILSLSLLEEVFSGRVVTTTNIAPYVLMLVDPATKA